MSDKQDELVKTKNAERQARYQKNQRALGRKPRTYWLSDSEASMVANLIQQLREDGQNLKQEENVSEKETGHKRFFSLWSK